MTPELKALLHASEYEKAGSAAEESLRQASSESPGRLLDAARGIVAWKGFFANNRDAASSEPYFRKVLSVLEELAGTESPAAMAAAENLAGLLGSLGRLEEAISLRRKVFAHVSRRFAPDDHRFMTIRDGLAFLYRRAGSEDDAARLYDEPGLCEHLAPAAAYLREHGARLVSLGRPWSDNCHVWAYFDSLLDCERLMRELRLDSCVGIHDHRGTHDGSERGLVCSVHHDAVMGPHPADAPAGIKPLPSA